MEPYYEHGGIVIYHGDCIDVMNHLAPHYGERPFDLLLTDPPYGIARVWKGGLGHGWGRAWEQSAVRNEWDSTPPSPEAIAQMMRIAKDCVIWGGNHFALPPSRGWLVWNKPERNFSLAEAELAWTTRDAVIRVKDLPRSESDRQHPTQKPEALMRWCLKHFPKTKTVLDPFMGSGTTLVAAKRLGKSCVGIEREERYCEIAVKRLRQEALPLDNYDGPDDGDAWSGGFAPNH